MPWLRSAAFTLALPAGCQYEPRARRGVAGMACEMVQRGAGSRSSRQIVADSDNLGLDRYSSVTTAHTSFGAAMPAESLDAALALYADIVRRPHLPADQLEDARSVSLQELRATEDEPVQRVMIRLKELHYGETLGHSPQGTYDGLMAIDSADVRSYFESHYRPRDCVLAIAGRFDWSRTVERVEELFADWPESREARVPPPEGRAGYEHLEHPSQQTHIGLSFPALSYDQPDYFTLRAAIGVLSDGMSSRLFDRVREQRGLCYSVSASMHSLRGAGGVFGYAGTTPERAQETLDVTLAEIRSLGSTVEEDELERFKVRIQSHLIMQQESSSSRASQMANDWYFLSRVLEPEEIEAKISEVTPDQIEAIWETLQLDQLRIVTLGPQPLRVAAPVG